MVIAQSATYPSTTATSRGKTNNLRKDVAVMGIYEICNLYNGKATAYVGSSADVGARWRQHRFDLRGSTHHNKHLQRAWVKYGSAAFEWYIIEEVYDEAELLEREQYWLDRFLENPDACYNMAHRAESPMRGYKHSKETRRKMSEGQKGKKLTEETKKKMSEANKGKKLTEEHRRNISESKKGNQYGLGHRVSEEARQKISEAKQGHSVGKGTPKSPEHRRKISEGLRGNSNALGHKRSEETKRKIGESHRGLHHTEEAKRRMGAANARPYPAFIHQETGEIIPAGMNLCKLCRERGLHRGRMYDVVYGQRNHHKGWTLGE